MGVQLVNPANLDEHYEQIVAGDGHHLVMVEPDGETLELLQELVNRESS